MLPSKLLVRPTAVKALERYCIWIRFSDGAAGEIDLSDLAGRGVFKEWSSRSFFEALHVTPAGGVAWGEDIELCPDALYMRLTSESVADIMPRAMH